ncbi:hypothetical protein PtB15_18B99 [Puccinia triticina]|nr:hypothetical protein PtB15_18B99 [Puccinia triticina]
MKRTYQGFSAPGQPNPNPPANLSYPPLPSGQPPPQPSSNPSASYQPQQPPANTIPPATSQPYPYPQFAPAPSASFGQYAGYPHAQPAAATHPAYANYGYGTPAGPQQPHKPYQGYPAPNTNQLPSNPNPIPQNPYVGYPPAQVNGPGLQNSPGGGAAQPPFKRPRYEANNNGAGYGSPSQPNPYPPSAPQPNSNALPSAPTPLRNNNNHHNHNNKMNHTPTGTMRIGASTNNTRGGFSGSRPPRSTGPFGNNSPIRLNLGPGGGTGGYDPGSAPHFEPPPAMAHPLPSFHQSPQASGNHYPPTSYNNEAHFPPYAANAGYPSSNNNDPSNPAMGGHSRGNNSFHSDFSPGGPSYNGAPPQTPNDPYRGPGEGPANHAPGSHRSGRGGFRGNSGNSMSGGRGPRDRNEMGGGEAMNPRGNRPYPNQSYGPSGKSERNGPGNRSIRGGHGHRHDDQGSNYGATGGGTSRHQDRSNGPANRGPRNISNLPTAPYHNKGHDRRGGGGVSNRGGGGMGDRNSGNRRGGGRINGRDGKFDDRQNPGRPSRGGGPGPNSGPGGDRLDKPKKDARPSASRAKLGWGIEFKEFNDREQKTDAKRAEETPARRPLTDFRINGLEIPILPWLWRADTSAGVDVMHISAAAGNLIENSHLPQSNPEDNSGRATGKHARDDDADEDDDKPAPGDHDNPAGPSTSSKKLKSDTVEMAKKIYEDAASAVTGLDLENEETNSDHEDNNLDQEINDQLLPDSSKKTLESREADPTSTPAVTADGDQNPEDLPQKESIPPIVIDDSESQTAAAAQPPSADQDQSSDPVHSDAQPSNPPEPENSRLRIYFSTILDSVRPLVAPAGLPNKPVVASGSGKRNVSGASVKSADTKLGGCAQVSSPVANLSPSKKTPKKETSLHPPSAEAVVKESPKPESSAAPVISTPDIVEIPKPDNPSSTKEVVDSKAEDVKPVKEESAPTAGPSGEKPAGDEVAETNGTDPAANLEAEDEKDRQAEYESLPAPEPQNDRISISYAHNSRRIVIDADVVQSIKVFRNEHRIEVLVRLMPAVIQGGKFDGAVDVYRICKGVLVEAFDPELKEYVVIDRGTLEASWRAKEAQTHEDNGDKSQDVESPQPSDDENPEISHDPLLPPLHRFFLSNMDGPLSRKAQKSPEGKPDVKHGFKQESFLIIATLDSVHPFTEAKWVRTGDLDSWISQMTGRIFRPEDTSEYGWRRKITVADPEPPPTIQHMLDTWLTTSTLGTLDSRQRFIDGHFGKDADMVMEILLRIIRMGQANLSFVPSPAPVILQQAISLHAPYPEQQTQVSLAVLSLYRISLETAVAAGRPVDQIIRRVTTLIRGLPYRLAFAAIDGIYRDEHGIPDPSKPPDPSTSTEP